MLLLAVVAILSVGVWSLVNAFGDRAASATPIFTIERDDVLDRLAVRTASDRADWSRLEITANQATVAVRLNAEATAAARTATIPQADSWVRLANAPDVMTNAEYLDLCGRDAGDAANEARVNVDVRLKDATSNAAIGHWIFSVVAACT